MTQLAVRPALAGEAAESTRVPASVAAAEVL